VKQEEQTMSIYGETIDRAIAALPKLKDTEATTYRSGIYAGIADAASASICGSPWAEVEVALRSLCLAVDRTIDANPVLGEIFDRPKHKNDCLCPICHIPF
jgi:hypothetical protein